MTLATPKILGLTATLLVLAATAISAALYQGRQAERYSLFNHYISELGEVGVSAAAWLMNGAFILGGLILMPFLFSVGLLLGSPLGWLATLAGVGAGLALAAVGVFPRNRLEPHAQAAMAFFRLGLVMVILFGLAVWFQPVGNQVLPRWVSLFSLLAAACYSSFLLITRPRPSVEPAETLDPVSVPERPRFWLAPILEWSIFIATILWLVGLAVAL